MSMRFFSPPEKPTLSARFRMSRLLMPSLAEASLTLLDEGRGRKLGLAARLALRRQAPP